MEGTSGLVGLRKFNEVGTNAENYRLRLNPTIMKCTYFKT